MGFWLIKKTVACKGPILSVKGHYMGLNLRLFWQIGWHMGADFQVMQSDGFTGVFFPGFPCIKRYRVSGISLPVSTGYIPRRTSPAGSLLPQLSSARFR